ncbi:MAG: hypothetical protein CMI63_17955 [Parvularcula sp.]|nr:hypothetical protein [Parvularcula sp.]
MCFIGRFFIITATDPFQYMGKCHKRKSKRLQAGAFYQPLTPQHTDIFKWRMTKALLFGAMGNARLEANQQNAVRNYLDAENVDQAGA